MICKICQSKENVTFTATEKHYGMGGEFLYFQCKDCKCLQIAEFPPDIAKYYPAKYYSFKLSPLRYDGLKGRIRLLPYVYSIFRTTLWAKILHVLMGPTRFDILHKLSVTKNSRILDVGCGSGIKYLYPLKEMGVTNVMGCDPFLDQELLYPNGLKILKGDIFNVQGTWDIIMYHHSFEHAPNPIENIEKVASLLAPNGFLILRIPTSSSFAWEHYGVNWYQLDAPRHYFLHSVESITFLAKKFGLSVFNITYDSSHKQFTNSEKYMRGEAMSGERKLNPLAFLKRKIERVINQRKAAVLNRQHYGDQAAFILQKKA